MTIFWNYLMDTFNDWIFNLWYTCYNAHFWCIFCSIYIIHYLSIVKKPSVRCGHRRFANFVSEHCPVIHKRFWVTPWCYDGGLHTVCCYFLRELLPNVQYTRRELIATEDGQPIALDWLETKESINNPNHPTMLILPGLNGDSQSNYVKPFVIQSHALGYRCIVFNFRGKAGVKLRYPTPFSPADYKDFQEVVVHVRRVLPNSRLLAVGTSFGAIILGQYVCHMGDNSQLEAAILVSGLYDTRKSINSMESHPLHAYFSKFLSDTLIKDFQPYEYLYKDWQLNFEDILKSQNLTEFAARFVVPVIGYDNVDHLHKLAALNDKLKNCKTPLLAICAYDDPFQPGEYLPTVEDIDGAPVSIVIFPKGGHLGFQDGFDMLKPSLAERLFVQFSKAIVEYRASDWKKNVNHG